MKLENLLLESKTDKAHLKVIDFGASERFDGTSKLVKKIGTPYYIAKEVLGNSGYNEKIDIWACGVILYIILCGYPPFYARKQEDLYRKIKKG